MAPRAWLAAAFTSSELAEKHSMMHSGSEWMVERLLGVGWIYRV